jgi:hypothetical protein
MKTNLLLAALALAAAPALAGCAADIRVGALQTESRSVEVGGAEAVRVQVNFGAGDLELAGGADRLLEADFTYNVARLKPEVAYTDGRLDVRQPRTEGLPALQDIGDFRNEWDLRLNDGVPLDLRLEVGGGTSALHLAGLSLTRLDVSLGAGRSLVDLGGDWVRDLEVAIDTGAADLTVRLPGGVGVRVEVDRGPTAINASGLTQDGNVYTNAAYGVSEVTLNVNLEVGIGWVNLEVDQ